MKRPTVLLTGDCSFLIAAFEKLLESEFELVGTARDEHALFSIASRRQPQVVVLDMSMPLAEDLGLTQRLVERLPDIKLILLGVTTDWDQVKQAFGQGASGYLLKTSEVGELSQAVHAVLKGKAYVTPLVTRNLVHSLVHETRGESFVSLTNRQREVLTLLVQGHTMKEVAATLKISPRTVAFHKYRIMSLLGISTTAELIRYALRHSLGSD
ncbi:MAG: response regulator transcription factor [Acidobacteriota bacterium]